MTMEAAVQALLAISEALDLPVKGMRRTISGNFFGPWIVNRKWSLRKQSSGPIRRRGPRTPRTVFRRMTHRTADNPRETIYSQDMYFQKSKNSRDSPVKSFTGRAKNIELKSSNLAVKEHDRFLTNTSSETELLGLNNAGATSKLPSSDYQKSSLPTLITLTSATGDHRATFGLGKPLEMNSSKLYVTTRRASPRIVVSAPTGTISAVHDFPHMQTYDKDEFASGKDPSDSLMQALEKRKTVPPVCEYEDISLHMKHYRMHHTVMGTGRFSLANQESQKSEIKPVQWQDVFPHRPLTAGPSVTDVPIFRFSVADFRNETRRFSPSPTRSPTKSRPPTPVVITNDAQGRTDPSGVTVTEDDKVSKHPAEEQGNGDMKKQGQYSTTDNMNNMYNVSTEGFRPILEEQSDDDDDSEFTDYRAYLRAQKTKEALSTSEQGSVSVDGEASWNETNEANSLRRSRGFRRTPTLSPVREKKDSMNNVEEAETRGKRDQSPAARSKSSQGYYHSIYSQRRVIATMAKLAGRGSIKQKLKVDEQRLMDSVDEKIEEGEKNLKQPFLRRAERDENAYIRYIVESSDNEDNTSENRKRHSKTSSTSSGKIGLVTAYDFKSYIKAKRSGEELQNQIGPPSTTENLLVQSKKLLSSSRDIRPSTVGEKATLVTDVSKHWCPNESRIKSEFGEKPKEEQDVQFPIRNLGSATLKYKPTSPATSAFVIAASSVPPGMERRRAVAGIDRQSVVMPLEEFMEIAVGGREKSFSQWSTCLNNSAKFGMGPGSRSGGDRKSRDSGLLKIVSFATPVNQFIFAKKVTSQSAQELSIGPHVNQQVVSSADGVTHNRSAPPYRLRLSDFGLKEKVRRKKDKKQESFDNASKEVYGNKDIISTDTDNVNITHKMQSKIGIENHECKAIDKQNVETTGNDFNVDKQTPLALNVEENPAIPSIHVQIPTDVSNEEGLDSILHGTESSKKVSSKRLMSASSGDSVHARLRQEILRLLAERRVKSARPSVKLSLEENRDMLISESSDSQGTTEGSPGNGKNCTLDRETKESFYPSEKAQGLELSREGISDNDDNNGNTTNNKPFMLDDCLGQRKSLFTSISPSIDRKEKKVTFDYVRSSSYKYRGRQGKNLRRKLISNRQTVVQKDALLKGNELDARTEHQNDKEHHSESVVEDLEIIDRNDLSLNEDISTMPEENGIGTAERLERHGTQTVQRHYEFGIRMAETSKHHEIQTVEGLKGHETKTASGLNGHEIQTVQKIEENRIEANERLVGERIETDGRTENLSRTRCGTRIGVSKGTRKIKLDDSRKSASSLRSKSVRFSSDVKFND